MISGPWSTGGRMLVFVPARSLIIGGDSGPWGGPALGPEYGEGFDCTGWRTPGMGGGCTAPGRKLAVDGARGRRAVVPGAAMLLRRSMPGLVRAASAGGTSDGREDAGGMGMRGEGTRGGSDGPGGEGNGTWSRSMLGRAPSRAKGLGMRSGRLLMDEADDGARGRPVGCGRAGLFWRGGACAIEDVRGGLCAAGWPPPTSPWSLAGRRAATDRGD